MNWSFLLVCALHAAAFLMAAAHTWLSVEPLTPRVLWRRWRERARLKL